MTHIMEIPQKYRCIMEANIVDLVAVMIGRDSGGARKNIEDGPAKYILIYKHKFFCCNKC